MKRSLNTALEPTAAPLLRSTVAVVRPRAVRSTVPAGGCGSALIGRVAVLSGEFCGSNRWLARLQLCRFASIHLGPLPLNDAVALGSAGVAPAVFGLWPKTFHRKKRQVFAAVETRRKQSAGCRLLRPGRSRSPFPTESFRFRPVTEPGRFNASRKRSAAVHHGPGYKVWHGRRFIQPFTRDA